MVQREMLHTLVLQPKVAVVYIAGGYVPIRRVISHEFDSRGQSLIQTFVSGLGQSNEKQRNWSEFDKLRTEKKHKHLIKIILSSSSEKKQI